MGQVKENLLTKGFSGRIGDEIVFRQIGNRTTFAKRPRKRDKLTPNQEAQHRVFQQAVYYARTVLINPASRAEYALAAKEANLRSAYIAAVTDYMRDPKIAALITSDYTGKVGDVILIDTVDEFKVIETTVTIKGANDAVIETGLAVRAEKGWLYTTKQANANVAGSKITATVKDRLNKTAVAEHVVGVN